MVIKHQKGADLKKITRPPSGLSFFPTWKVFSYTKGSPFGIDVFSQEKTF